MRKLLVATQNPGKLSEIVSILSPYGLEVISPMELEVRVDIVEDGQTFRENALKKALAYHRASGMLTLADDSGLEIDALDGAPGVLSSRFLGEKTSYSEKMREILDMLESIPDEERTARFICEVAIVKSEDNVWFARGVLDGIIARSPSGKGGFGYDPIFYLPDTGKTLAELTPKEKNSISHRGQAFREAARMLARLIETGEI
ncbi:MAG: non-canonical purine NTP pyrophosphatase, RdgB/HAM1 family [candidate division Zixibacteria bacterium 4484_93]|nr:MAG: non-canonical purine NTP pyrophosphatase, RdgB/HAM1 family [candidate division Zixibacteria bacterium 4484_93]